MATLSSTALLVLDMQNDIVKRGHRHEGQGNDLMPRAIKGIARLQSWARERQVPIIYTVVCYRPSFVDAPYNSPARKRPNFLIEGTPGTEVIDELKPMGDEIVLKKRRTGAFHGSELELLLHGYQTQTLIVTGTGTHRAVESTVREAHSRDYESWVVSDACADGSAAFHDSALAAIADWFGEVITVDDVLARF